MQGNVSIDKYRMKSWFQPSEYIGNLNELFEDLTNDLEEYGEIKFPHMVSGKKSLTGVKSLTNIIFTLSKYLEKEEMLRAIRKNEGEQGVGFILIEAKEWVDKDYTNPGYAWEEYPTRWERFLNYVGEMDYSYNERIYYRSQIEKITDELVLNPATRQAYISIYQDEDIQRIGKEVQIPCIIGYQLEINNDRELNMTTIMRSCDLQNCLANDIYLANSLREHILLILSKNMIISRGSLTFTISNLHRYPKI